MFMQSLVSLETSAWAHTAKLEHWCMVSEQKMGSQTLTLQSRVRVICSFFVSSNLGVGCSRNRAPTHTVAFFVSASVFCSPNSPFWLGLWAYLLEVFPVQHTNCVRRATEQLCAVGWKWLCKLSRQASSFSSLLMRGHQTSRRSHQVAVWVVWKGECSLVDAHILCSMFHHSLTQQKLVPGISQSFFLFKLPMWCELHAKIYWVSGIHKCSCNPWTKRGK